MRNKPSESAIGVGVSDKLFTINTERILLVLMNGVAIIVMGFISYGVLHTHTKNFMPWQWYYFSPANDEHSR